MYPEILPLYGTFAIQSYGLAMVIGIILYCWLVLRDPRRKSLITSDQFIHFMFLGTLVALVGARILHIIHEWHTFNAWYDWLAIWHGGFSFMGGLVALVFFIPAYLRVYHIPLLPFFDLLALYAPLLQAVGRIGCFFAGCCCGIPTTSSWGVIFTNPRAQGLLNIPLHPTQLYSVFSLTTIFLILYFVVQRRATKPGQLFCWYLLLISSERFCVDFFRADREFIASHLQQIFSIHQLIALGLFFFSMLLCAYVSLYTPTKNK